MARSAAPTLVYSPSSTAHSSASPPTPSPSAASSPAQLTSKSLTLVHPAPLRRHPLPAPPLVHPRRMPRPHSSPGIPAHAALVRPWQPTCACLQDVAGCVRRRRGAAAEAVFVVDRGVRGDGEGGERLCRRGWRGYGRRRRLPRRAVAVVEAGRR